MNNNRLKKDSLVSAAEVKAINKPFLDGKADDFSNSTFWQYTSVESIEHILSGDCFWVNNISRMNDLHEAELHEKENQDIFVQCFCNSDTEKIPMWYLYGGIVGKGASIGFTPAVMRDYIKSIKFVTELVYDSATNNYVPGEQFEIGRDFELQTGWVFYANYNNPDKNSTISKSPVKINYRNVFVYVKEADEFFDKNYFIKDYPWEYEKEFRLVFINKTGKKIYKIKIEIPEEFRTKPKKIKIRLAPEFSSSASRVFTGGDFKSCSDRIHEKGKKYLISVTQSGLRINMDLLGRNRNDINDHVINNPDYLKEEVQKRVAEFYTQRTALPQ